MKKIFKILLVYFCFFCSVNFVLADEPSDNIPDTNSKVETQKQAITNYCTEGSKLVGCLYDKNNEMYTTMKKGKQTYIIPPMTNDRPYTGYLNIPEDVKVLRAYQAFDGDGKAIYAACYRYDYNGYSESDRSGLGNGTYFFFRFISEDKKGTCSQYTVAIPSEGTRSYTYIRNVIPFTKDFWKFKVDTTYEYDGQESVEGQNWLTGENYYMRFNEWKAVDGGDCPKVFGYTANTRWYTSGSNRYIFSNDASDFKIGTISFWHGEEYVSRPGCTVDDEAGEQVNRDLLYNEIKKEIDAFQCPDNISDMYELSNDLTSYYDTLRNDENNKYRVLWSHDLAEEVIDASEAEINKYIKQKLTSCQYKICDINVTEQTKIKQNLGEKCKLGCSVSNYKKPSTDAGAKCYCCGGSQGCTYTWTNASPNQNQCALQENVPLGLCIGTTKDAECRSCLLTAYDKAGLSEDKKKCLMDSEILKNVTEQDLKDANNDASDEALDTEMKENEELREQIFQSLLKEPNLNFYTGPISCSKLLGDNLIAVIKFVINLIRVGAVIATIVLCMMTMLPAVTNGDAGEFNKAVKKCIWTVVVMLLIILAPVLLRTIGNLFSWDLCGLF